MKNKNQKSDFCDTTVSQAIQLASQHQDDPDWDFWSSKEESNDPDSEDNDSLARQRR